MEKMNNLRDLLKHEIQDLYSAEEQIIDALPGMIEKASNTSLKNSLREHLRITEKQKQRLDQVMQMMHGGEEETPKRKGLLGLFSSKQKCKGMEGIIDEGKKVMGEDMHPDVMDAAIIAAAQKVEHYEICGYGTARSYAEELGMNDVAALLEETLDEEYEADDKLTFLAETRVNKEAERTSNRTGSNSSRGNANRETSHDTARRREMEMEPVSRKTSSRSASGSGSANAAPKGSSSRSSTGRTTAAKKSSATRAASKSSGSTGRSSNTSGRSGNGSRSRGR